MGLNNQHTCLETHLEGETTSKQNRLSLSAQGLTVHKRKSSTTTVGWSCERDRSVCVGTFIHFFVVMCMNMFVWVRVCIHVFVCVGALNICLFLSF